MRAFTHLQVHSHYSLLGSTASIDALCEQAAADGMSHLALTDSNCMYGAVAFDTACRSAGVHPILGMTLAVCAPDMWRATSDLGRAAAAIYPFGEMASDVGHLVLLAMNRDGYRSLCRISSALQGCPTRGELTRSSVDWSTLKANRRGLVCLSGGRRGWVERLVRAGDQSAGYRYASHLAGIFGESAYLSLSMNEPRDVPIAHEMLDIGNRIGMPAVAVQPVYCLRPQDAERLRLLAAIGRNCRLADLEADAHASEGDGQVDLHWLSPDEVGQRFAEFPQVVEAVAEIVARSEPALPRDNPLWPAVKLPEGTSADEALADAARTGLAQRYGGKSIALTALNARLERELEIIERHGYAPLFLVVADITRYAREQHVPYGTRGSVANSLVAYCTGITTIDPMAHDLLFERFLSPERADPPDIDMNFCSRRRDRILRYLRDTYGTDHVALVSTISTMGPKSAVRESAKAHGLDEREIRQLMATIPREALSRWHRRDDIPVDELIEGIAEPRWRQIVEAAWTLLGQPHHLSLHPGGVVVTPVPLTDVLPVQWTPKGFLATQFGQEELKALGLPKIDLLGVRALTVLSSAEKLVRNFYDPDFRINQIPVTQSSVEGSGERVVDAETEDLLECADTVGVFQCESSGARLTQRKLKTRTVFDLAVANAFFKPAPALGGMAQQFVLRYRGEEPAPRLPPILEPILGKTKGVILFQEQVLRVAREVAQLSWAEAHALRRGELKAEELNRVHDRFVAGCQQPSTETGDRGLTESQAASLWEQVTAFAGFSLNQGHAAAYADLSYRMAYVKARWPAAFLCARLADWGGFHHQAIYIAEAQRLEIRVNPPHVNHSGRRFTLEVSGGGETSKHRGTEPPTLWMGLGQVRDLRNVSLSRIIEEQSKHLFQGLRDLMQRVALQKKEIEHLIQCGALDGLGDSRSSLLTEAEDIHLAGSAAQMSFSFGEPTIQTETPAQRVAWERFVLGQPVSIHPLALVAEILPKYTPLRSLPGKPLPTVTLAGVRLPGWTGGRGFFVGDGESYITVEGGEGTTPPAWQPLLLRGQWRSDRWGTFWLQADSVVPVK